MKRAPLRRKSSIKPKRKAKQPGAREWMAKVAQLPCVICGSWPVHVHHCISSRYGTAKASDFNVIPLCPACHLDGPNAIHRGKASWETRNGPDWSYLERVKAMIEK
jgi:5-methylcytosine-specific restriction endonuclease McrA